MKMKGLSYWLNGKLYLSVTKKLWSKAFVELKGPSFSFPKESGFSHLPNDKEPSAKQIFDVVQDAFDQNRITVDSMKADEITFAGYGEPLAKLDVITDAAKMIKESRHGVPLRVLTSGLVPAKNASNVISKLKQSGIKHLSVALMADNPKKYKEIVQPSNGCSFNDVCAFISTSVEAGNVNLRFPSLFYQRIS
jgi:TatD family-associated radical SAM protein